MGEPQEEVLPNEEGVGVVESKKEGVAMMEP